MQHEVIVHADMLAHVAKELFESGIAFSYEHAMFGREKVTVDIAYKGFLDRRVEMARDIARIQAHSVVVIYAIGENLPPLYIHVECTVKQQNSKYPHEIARSMAEAWSPGAAIAGVYDKYDKEGRKYF